MTDSALLRDVDRMAAAAEERKASPNAATALAYNVTLDDLVAFAEYHTAHSPAVRSNYYWSLGIGTIAVLVVLWGYGFRSVGGWAGVVAALVGWVVYLNWRTADANRRYYRRAYSEGANRGMLGFRRLSADPEGLRATTDVTDESMSWKVVERIVSAPGFALIYVGSLNAYMIPEARVVEGDFSSFIETVLRLHADSLARMVEKEPVEALGHE